MHLPQHLWKTTTVDPEYTSWLWLQHFEANNRLPYNSVHHQKSKWPNHMKILMQCSVKGVWVCRGSSSTTIYYLLFIRPLSNFQLHYLFLYQQTCNNVTPFFATCNIYYDENINSFSLLKGKLIKQCKLSTNLTPLATFWNSRDPVNVVLYLGIEVVSL